MKREIAYTEQQLTESFLLNMQRNAMIAMSKMIESLFNSTTVVHGLTCVPTAPASLQVQISAGEIYQSAPLDATDYGVLPADTSHNIMKQGILLDAVVRNCPAPTTNGFAINYLIQAGFQENDGDPQTLNFYNSANPASPLQSSLNTKRDGQCIVTAKAGIAAASGTQTTLAADAGFVGLWVVTVTYGQTTIVAGNIVQAANAPFIGSVASNLLASNAALLGGYPASHFLSSTDVATDSSKLGGALPAAYIQHSLATAANDFLVASGAGAFVKKTLAQVKTLLGLGTAATGDARGLAAAWVNFSASGGVISIRKAFNVSSVTRNGVGDYTINFTTPMSDANFVVTGSSVESGGAGPEYVSALAECTSAANTYSLKTINAVRIVTTDLTTNGVYEEAFSCNVVIFD